MQNCQLVYLAKGKAGPPVVRALYASRPAAGFPAPGDDSVERMLDLNDLIVKNPHATFYVRAEGDSMEGVGIFSGDILVVDRSEMVLPGKIVVAAVYGELVVKRYERHAGQPALCSANDAYAPVMVGEGDDVYIWGVVTGSVRIW